jgi:hypothetical protein
MVQEGPAFHPASAQDSIAALKAVFLARKRFEHEHFLATNLVLATKKASIDRTDCEAVVTGTDFCSGPRNGGAVLYHSPVVLKADYSFHIYGRVAEKPKWAALGRYMAAIENGAAAIPGDPWLAVERVSVFLEHALVDSAIKASLRCTVAAAFCAALQAYTLNEIGHHARADSAWTRALAAMDVVTRCAFVTDTGVVADSALRRNIAEMNCLEREEFFNRLWWLADPLWGDSYNERRAEQLSRRSLNILFPEFSAVSDSVISEMERKLLGTDNFRLPLDERKPLFAMYWLPPPPAYLPQGRAAVVERLGEPHLEVKSLKEGYTNVLYVHGHYAFVPSASAIRNPLYSKPADWNLHDSASYEKMSALPRIYNRLEYQLAFFRRGDSARVVVATDTERDHDFRRALVTAALILQSDPEKPPSIARSFDGPLYRFDLAAPANRTVASLEVTALGGVGGRLRFGAGPPENPFQRLAVSDVLVLLPRSRLPANLDEAVGMSAGTHYVDMRYPMALFWEMYGLQAGERARVKVELRELPAQRSLLNMLSRSEPRVLSSEWEDGVANGEAIEPRSVNLSLSTLRPGKYALSLSVSVPGQVVVTSTREVELLARGAR